MIASGPRYVLSAGVGSASFDTAEAILIVAIKSLSFYRRDSGTNDSQPNRFGCSR